ncbi:MAG: glycosyltransferase family 1 protein [Pyrinomonadaceae bacterium]|nr:glycosyltransferase family 1 protein [Pyrinomonadaceae bacterium]
MSKIVLAPYGSLGDLHPLLAIAIELRDRGHDVKIVTLEAYREKIGTLGFEFSSLSPDLDPEDREAAKRVMDSKSGSETLITEFLLPAIRDSYEDLLAACDGADVLVAGEVVFASHSVAEKLNLKLVSTTMAPLSMFSAYEPNIFPNAEYLKYLNFLGPLFQRFTFSVMTRVIKSWFEDYRAFRTELGLDPDHDPLVWGRFSKDLHLALFSEAFGKPRPDWPESTVQTGFCFYDGRKDLGVMPDELLRFIENGEPPIVFTLGSAAVMDPGDYFEKSIAAAKLLEKRAVCLYGIFNERPHGLDSERVGYDYAPFGELFPKAACIVHQAGVGTTAQVLKAGVPHLIVPFSHDQPDNAARCVRRGVARTIRRTEYSAELAARELEKVLTDKSYKAKAGALASIIASESGTETACDAIEQVLSEG